MDEISPTSGTLVASTELPYYGYSTNSTFDGLNQVYNFLYHPVNQPSVVFRLIYSVLGAGQTLNSAGIDFSLFPSALKLEIEVQNWSFLFPNDSLCINLQLNLSPNITAFHSSNNGNITTFVLTCGNAMIVMMNMLNLCELNNVTTAPVDFTLDPSTLLLSMTFPPFQSLLYDPDFSVLLTGSGGSSSTSQGDGGGGSNLLPLVALAALAVVPVVALAAGAAILAYLVIRRYQQTRALANSSSSQVNF